VYGQKMGETGNSVGPFGRCVDPGLKKKKNAKSICVCFMCFTRAALYV
jgi:hypothetical protein